MTLFFLQIQVIEYAQQSLHTQWQSCQLLATTWMKLLLCSLLQLIPLHPSTAGCPDIGPQMESTPNIIPGSVTVTWQAVQTTDPLLSDLQYAVYSQCGSEGTFQLVAENIEGVSYTVSGLPAPSTCVLRVVAYHKYCLRDLEGEFQSTTDPFITAIKG